MSNPDWKESYLREEDEDGYVPFNRDRRLGQNQYASRYARGILDTPDFGQGLRWKGLERGDYHSIRIHKEDLETFHRRVNAYKVDATWGRAKEAEHYLDM